MSTAESEKMGLNSEQDKMQAYIVFAGMALSLMFVAMMKSGVSTPVAVCILVVLVILGIAMLMRMIDKSFRAEEAKERGRATRWVTKVLDQASGADSLQQPLATVGSSGRLLMGDAAVLLEDASAGAPTLKSANGTHRVAAILSCTDEKRKAAEASHRRRAGVGAGGGRA